MAHFKQAPLPFTGQKRMFLKHFEKILNENIQDDGQGWTIVDVFGGSGLLSHTAKHLKPNARVIYNDFDNYTETLKYIDDINCLREQLLEVLKDIPKNKKIPNTLKPTLMQIVNDFKGYKCKNLLCAWLNFSGQQVSSIEEVFKKDLWNCVRATPYPKADRYLDGIKVVSESFYTLIPKFKDQEKVLLILDPPYLCTNQKSYKQASYFDLIDFLRLINLTKPPYIFFSSTKSEFIRFIDYMEEAKIDNWESFENCERITVKSYVSHNNHYEDNLVYRF